uniref:Uncharacterized protein n=1 Tax=Oryza glumipatula TaxID=40148 RepID=A0A0E0APR9_9ORYZ
MPYKALAQKQVITFEGTNKKKKKKARRANSSQQQHSESESDPPNELFSRKKERSQLFSRKKEHMSLDTNGRHEILKQAHQTRQQVACQELAQPEGKVKAGLSFEQVLPWEDAFASAADKVAVLLTQQETTALALRKDPEVTIGGHQEREALEMKLYQGNLDFKDRATSKLAFKGDHGLQNEEADSPMMTEMMEQVGAGLAGVVGQAEEVGQMVEVGVVAEVAKMVKVVVAVAVVVKEAKEAGKVVNLMEAVGVPQAEVGEVVHLMEAVEDRQFKKTIPPRQTMESNEQQSHDLHRAESGICNVTGGRVEETNISLVPKKTTKTLRGTGIWSQSSGLLTCGDKQTVIREERKGREIYMIEEP